MVWMLTLVKGCNKGNIERTTKSMVGIIKMRGKMIKESPYKVSYGKP